MLTKEEARKEVERFLPDKNGKEEVLLFQIGRDSYVVYNCPEMEMRNMFRRKA
jgi:hypothetical protein